MRQHLLWTVFETRTTKSEDKDAYGQVTGGLYSGRVKQAFTAVLGVTSLHPMPL